MAAFNGNMGSRFYQTRQVSGITTLRIRAWPGGDAFHQPIGKGSQQRRIQAGAGLEGHADGIEHADAGARAFGDRAFDNGSRDGQGELGLGKDLGDA